MINLTQSVQKIALNALWIDEVWIKEQQDDIEISIKVTLVNKILVACFFQGTVSIRQTS